MRRLRRTTLLTVACLSVLAGLGLSRRINLPLGFWVLLALPSLVFIKRRNYLSLGVIVIFGLAIGLWRGGIFMQRVAELNSLSGQTLTIEATATSDSIYSTASQLEFTANHIRLQPTGKDLAGSFKISGFGEPMIYRGDRVSVRGKLYPMRGSNQARIAYAQLKRTGLDNSFINRFTRQFSAGMQTALPEPNASFGLGLLIGQRNGLPSELTNQLIMVGLVHIVAVSGYNLTILVRAVSRLRLGSKYQRLVASLVLIFGFVLMAGFSASIVRAALVSILGLWAWYFGRKFRPILLLSLAAAITAFLKPFYIWGDLGWYLSFLAFFGVLVIAPAISKRLFARRPKLITTVVLETLSAELMTLPLIMLSFGQLSLVGLLANVLVVPLIPLAMLLCAIAAAGGMWLAPVAGWLAWPANALLTYILDVVKILSSIPGIFLHRSISLPSMLYFYGLLLLIVSVLFKQHRGASRNINLLR